MNTYADRLSHLSEKEIETLEKRYYSGENVKRLIDEYGIDISPGNLYKTFPPKVIDEKFICEYCNAPLVVDPKSKNNNNYSDDDVYCPICGHRPYGGICHCVNCQQKEKTAEENKRDLINKMYSGTPGTVDFQNISFKKRVYLGAVCRLLLSEDMYTCCPYNERGTDIKLTPSEEWTMNILKELRREDIILVSELSSIDAFSTEEGDEFPTVYYVGSVMYKLNLNYPPRKEELFDEIMNPTSIGKDNNNEAYDLWLRIAEEECKEFLLYELSKVDFEFNPGEKTQQLFKQLLQDFSVAQIYGIIYKSVSEASRYYLQENISRKRAANSVVGSCRRFAEKALSSGWTLTNYGRRRDLPQSELSSFFFNRVLRIGEKGFTEKPTMALIQNNNNDESD